MPKKKAKRVPADKGRTRDPMQGQTSTARKRAAKGKKVGKGADGPDRAQCTAHKRNGDRCSNPPVRGAKVCRMHGGSAPQVKAKANQRLIEMILPALAHLKKIIDNPKTSDADKLKAINMVLNRTGYSERQQIDVGLREPTPFDNLDHTAFVILRGEENVRNDELDGADEPDALPGGGGGQSDEALDAFLDARERARAREASTKLDNSGHEVVGGKVQREAMDPFGMEEKERAASMRPGEFAGGPGPEDEPWEAYERRVAEGIDRAEGRRA